MKLNTIKNTVIEILKTDKKARNSDDYLFTKVITQIAPDYTNYPFWVVMINRSKNNLPSYESVSRCRRKAQAEYPELAADSNVITGRDIQEAMYRDFATKGE